MEEQLDSEKKVLHLAVIMYLEYAMHYWLLFQDFCLDLFEPSGHGRKRKRQVEGNSVLGHDDERLPKAERLIKRFNDSTPYTKIKENIEYTVMMPGGKSNNKNNCLLLKAH